MPYSNPAPPVVFPDTAKGHFTAARFIGGDCDVAYCREYEPEMGESMTSISPGGTVWRGRCRNRELPDNNMARRYSWCTRCPCGFLSLEKGEELPA